MIIFNLKAFFSLEAWINIWLSKLRITEQIIEQYLHFYIWFNYYKL